MKTFIKLSNFRNFLWAALICATGLPPGIAAAAEAGKFQFVIGDIKVVSASGAQRVPVKGESFIAGDTIVTGSSGSAQIRMSDGGTVAVRPDTQLKLDQYVFNGREDGSERKLVSLIKGGFRAITGLIGNRNKGNYKILTPSATIGIRGTDHEAVVIPSGATGGFQAGTYDRVYRGATIIETDKGKLIVNPNQVGFTPGKGAAPVLLPRIPEFFETRAQRPDVSKDTQQDASNDGDGGSESKADAKSSSARSAATLKSSEGKEAATTLRSPLDATTVKDRGTSSTLKGDLIKGETTLTTPLDTRSTPTLKDATLSTPATSTLKSDALSTPVTVPAATLRSTDVLSAPVTTPATTLKTPTTTTITTPITTTKPITTTVTPKTEAITVPPTTIRSTTKP